MVNETYRELLRQVIGLLDTACQASLELLAHYAARELETVERLLSGLRAAAQAVNNAQEPLLPQLGHACTVEMLENVQDTLDEIEHSVQADASERAAMKMEFQLFPFLRQLREMFYFWGVVYPDKERMNCYYQEEFAARYQNLYLRGREKAKFRLSIVVPAYNHLDTTKRCIKQLLKETDLEKLDAELILFDHGSTDGTLEFFESLNCGKVVHFKNNVRMYMFATMLQVCQGEYFAYVSNDVLVTRNWAELLMRCLDSDEKIIAAVPATPNISNFQTVGLPNLDADGFAAWANGQNEHDPSRWDDRARLMPPLGMFRTGAVSALGFADPSFYSMEFWDDDFSLRARRAGYRQLVCNDVACYHYGSVTGREAQQKENTLVYGRELFKNKHRIDPWGNGFCYDYQAVQLLMNVLPSQKSVSILGLDCGFGDTPLQIRNILRHRRQDSQIYQLTSQEQYLPDIKPHSVRAYFTPNLAAGLREHFQETEFHCAFLGRELGEYEDYANLLAAVSRRLAPGGQLVCCCANPFHVVTLQALLRFALPNDRARLTLIHPNEVKKSAEQYFSSVQITVTEQKTDELDQFVMRHYGGAGQHEINQMQISQYYFVCRK